MTRFRLLVLGMVAVALLAGACSKRKYDSEKIVDFVDVTTPHAYRFVYTATTEGRKVVVQGILEDDFRYKMQVSIDGRPSIEQIVSDDAVAMRFLDTSIIDDFIDEDAAPKAETKTNIAGATVLDALRAGRWVLDAAGAPSVVIRVREGDDAEATFDPLFDARTALSYVRRVAEGQFFEIYDAESLNPTYRVDEDPFPNPTEDSGITRYNSIIDPLPSAAAATTQGAGAGLPGMRNFRKMAVYVQGGRIIGVKEFIGLSPRQLDDFRDYMTRLVEVTAPDNVVTSFRETIAQLRADPEAEGQFLLTALNSYIDSSGRNQLKFRLMTLDLEDFDDPSLIVEMPDKDVVRGSLAILQNLGQKPEAEADSTEPTTGDEVAATGDGS